MNSRGESALLWIITIVLTLYIGLADAAAGDKPNWLTLSLQDPKGWKFVEGPWTQNAEGVMAAPGNNGDGNLAVYAGKAYKDFEAQFEFRADSLWTDPGLVFRASDPTHYYVVHFPYVGQQYRSENFQAAISKVGNSGYVEVLSMELVHGVSSAPKLWRKVKVAVQGNRIQVWVEGRPLRPVIDDSYAGPGFVGLSTDSSAGAGAKSVFRNVRILGEPQEAPKWDGSQERIKPYFVLGGGKGCSSIVRASNGDLLAIHDAMATPDVNRMLRSKDNARTWSQAELLPSGTPNAMLYATKDAALGLLTVNSVQQPFKLRKAVSKDSGQTWQAPVDVATLSFPENQAITEVYPSQLLRLKDGALLMLGYAAPKIEAQRVEGRHYFTVTALGTRGFCFRSEDDGQSWSGPINLDGPPYDNATFLVAKEFSEVSAAQTKEGKIIALTRPNRSTVMWETWSEDGGKTWAPQARGPFPMWASIGGITTTSSGAIIVAGRFPGIAAQVSRDNGMSWKCYKIDNAMWAQGFMYEVEPDVVLFIYGGKDSPQELRGQLIKLTPEGLFPVR
jgi:hypothetical protein